MKYPIDRRERVALGGLRQTIHIWGTRAENPVLLFLHGGPGVPNRDGIARRHLDLTDDFTVVAWDQRGTGGSYLGCPAESLTLERLILDGGELLEYLCRTLQKEKVFLLGGSWGTELGTFLCLRFPRRVGGYVGYGQVVSGVENETRSWDFTLRKARQARDQKAVDTLLRVGPPVGGQYKPVLEGLLAQRALLSKYGGHSMKKESMLRDTVWPILSSRELSARDKLGVIRGYRLCLEKMWPSVVRYDFAADRPVFQMPYYIFQGVHDENTPSSLVQAYFDGLTAPDKALIWFENSAHGPLGEEPEKFKRALRERLLPLAGKDRP